MFYPKVTILPFSYRFPQEAALVGRLVIGYGELEVSLFDCVVQCRLGHDVALKAMFTRKGETARINVARKMGHPGYEMLRLGDEFDTAINGMRYCVKVRNQYAHRQWYDDNTGRLAFVNLEELAQKNESVADLLSLTRYYVDVPLLKQQESYFVNVRRYFDYLNMEGQLRSGRMTHGHAFTKPVLPRTPPLYL